MPFDYEVDCEEALVTVHAKECVTPKEAVAAAQRLLRDPAIDQSFGVLVVVDHSSRDSTPQELRELAEILKMLDRKLHGRKALVATDAGRVTTARIVALIASTHDDVEAFTTEDAARAWLAASPSA